MADTLGWAVTAEQVKTLNGILAELLIQSEADGVFMSDYGGNLIAYSTSEDEDDSMHTMSALAAGSFVATRELAGLIGETAFQSMFHQGSLASIYIHCVLDRYLLLVVFKSNTTAGLVKLYVQKTHDALAPVVEAMEAQSANAAKGAVFEFNEDSSASIF